MTKTAERWFAEQVRVTAFLAADDSTGLASVSVGDLLATEADSIEARPREGTREESVTFGPGVFHLVVRPDRIDFLWSASSPWEPGSPGLGHVRGALDMHLGKVSPWLVTNTRVVRLAVAAQAVEPVPDKAHGYGTIDEYLSLISIDEPSTSDLVLQINRPIDRTFDGFAINVNRVTQWACRTFARHRIVLDPTGARSGNVSSEAPPIFLTSCNLDFSTDARRVAPLASELLAIVANGLKTELLDVLDGRPYA